MKIGFDTAGCGRVPLAEVLPHLHQYGYECVEICTWPGHPAHPDTADVQEIRQLLADTDLELSALHSHVAWVYDDPQKEREAIGYTKRCLDLAQVLEAPVINTNAGPYPEGMDPWMAWEVLVHSLQEACAHAKEVGVYLAMECHVGHMVLSWESALKLIKDVNSPALKINFDPAHWAALGLDDLTALEKLISHVVHAHAKDFVFLKPPLARPNLPRNTKAVALGDGEYDLPCLLLRLKQLGYNGVVSAELFVEDIDQAAERSAAYMKRIMRHLA